MIKGIITIEDHTIEFDTDFEKSEVTFTVTDKLAGIQETKTVNQAKFFKALAIAVHNDGMPDYNIDYPEAESVMGEIRWIP